MATAACETIEGLAGEHEQLAAARSRAYALIAEALRYPDDELRDILFEGGLSVPLYESLSALSPGFAIPAERWRTLQDVGSADDLAVEYTRLFDVGASGPPCPLYGGLYAGDRMKTMEEAVRFYNHFGLTLSEAQRELPDHVSTQLEFMHYLSFREAEALHTGADPGSFRRAQRDFVSRHLGAWIPELCKRLERENAPAYFTTLIATLAELLSWDREHLAD